MSDKPVTDSEKLLALVRLVEEVRDSQRLYFKTKGGLDECKKREKALDDWVKRFREENSPQRKLFGG